MICTASGGVARGKGKTMGRVIRAVLFLGVIAFLALIGYAYLGDLSPDQADVVKPVILNVDQ